MRWQLANPVSRAPTSAVFCKGRLGQRFQTKGRAGCYARWLQRLRRDARHDHGLLRDRAIAFAAFGNYVVPLQIGAPDMTFPKINMASYWTFFISCIIMMASFFVPRRRREVGLDVVSAVANIADMGADTLPFFNGQTLWLVGHGLQYHRFLAGIGELHRHDYSAPRAGHDVDASALSFVWTQFITAFLLCSRFLRSKRLA
jgi:hypothetical protein